MFTKISHLSIFVSNQDEALHFFTNKLGLKKNTDVTMDNGFRWLTVSATGAKNQDPFEIALILATTPEQKAAVGKQGLGMPVGVLKTDDCKGDAAKFKANGVTILKEPTQEMWGIESLFADLYGNAWDMVQ